MVGTKRRVRARMGRMRKMTRRRRRRREEGETE